MRIERCNVNAKDPNLFGTISG